MAGGSRLAIRIATIAVLIAPGAAFAQNLMVLNNATDGELRFWSGWARVDNVSTTAFLAMPLSTILTYDAIEMSGYADPRLTTPEARAKFLAAVNAGVGIYSTIFTRDPGHLPGSVTLNNTVDRCERNVTLTAAGRAHPIITYPNPDITGTDLSSAPGQYCQIHGSLASLSSEYQVLALAATTGNPAIAVARFGCGYAVVKTHHFCAPRLPTPTIFTDSLARYLIAGAPSSTTDTDGDGVRDACDSCPSQANASQSDCDLDGIGDACDADSADSDGDGISNNCDSCPTVPNPIQPRDGDGDGIDDACDNCPSTANSIQDDCDQDGIGDACSSDVDGDKVPDGCDNCANDMNPLQWDTDDDGIGNNCDWVHSERDLTADTMIKNVEPSTSFGARGHVWTMTGAYASTKVLMKFDEVGIDPRHCPIVNLEVYQQTKTNTFVDLHVINADWSEGSVNFGSLAGAYDARALAQYHAVGEIGTATIDLRPFIQEWANGRPNHGILFMSGGPVKYATKENMTASRRPKVKISCIEREPGVDLLIAEGADTPNPKLYRVNAATGALTQIGFLSQGITAMETAADGTIYGTTDTFGVRGELVRIDPATATSELIGPTTSAVDGVNRAFLDDCTFHEGGLYCWSRSDETLVLVDHHTGLLTVIGGGTWSIGTGLASNGAQMLLAPHGAEGALFDISPTTAATVELGHLHGTTGELSAMTFMNGRLYAIEHDDIEYNLVEILLPSGNFRRIAQLPDFVEAITPDEYQP